MSENKHKGQSASKTAVEDKQQDEKVEQQTSDAAEKAVNDDELELSEESRGAEDSLDKLTKKYDESQKKCEALNNDYLRLMAEFDNYRKRTLKEKAELLKNGGEDALKKILPVIDDFERALAALETSDDIKAVKEGINLIYTKFQGYLEANGIKEISAIGEPFDTEVHEAITTFPAPTPEQKGKVIDCMTKGYKLNDKVIRFSKVVVGE
ncbi:MAG: nucleotide exchange factor GrpE [Bacteroidales bacterium]|nr:nucleotide exchange factor GrpE [Bacteroidales bacterium]